MSQKNFAPPEKAANPHIESIVNKILAELNDFGDSLDDKWSNIAQSLNIMIVDEGIPLPNNAGSEKDDSRKVITLWVEKCIGRHIWPGLIEAIEKEIPSSNILLSLRSKYLMKNGTNQEQRHIRRIVAVTETLQHYVGRSLQLNFHIYIASLAILILLLLSVGRYTERLDPVEKQLAENPLSAQEWLEVSVRTIRMLVTGKTGTGKSTLINSLFGYKVAVEGHNLTLETTEVKSHTQIANGIPLIIFDSPGLQDGLDEEEAYIEDMVSKCTQLDLIMYTIRMDNERIPDDDMKAMKTLTDAFGMEFWKRSMIVLTFANKVQDPSNPENVVKNVVYFNYKLKKWTENLPHLFKTKLKMPDEIADSIPIIPAGYFNQRDLPGLNYWFTNFWMTALKRMKETGSNSHNYMLHYSKDRFKQSIDASDEDFEKETHEQPIFWHSFLWPF